MTADDNDYTKTHPNSYWAYSPSLAVAILFALFFGVSTIMHVFQMVRYKKWFCWVIIMAGIWETASFTLRALASRKQDSGGLAIPALLLVILAPLLINGFVYMVLARMAHFFLPSQEVLGIPARRLSLIFVILDIVAFFVQGISGTMLNSKNPKTVQLGMHIYMVGVGFQECFIVIFLFAAFRFQKHAQQEGIPRPTPYRPLLFIVYAVLGLITIRIIFRLAEFAGGFHSALPSHEVYFYLLEATPMVVALALFNVIHPGKVLVGPESGFPKLSKQEKREAKALNRAQKEEKKKAKKEGRHVRLGDDDVVALKRIEPSMGNV